MSKSRQLGLYVNQSDLEELHTSFHGILSSITKILKLLLNAENSEQSGCIPNITVENVIDDKDDTDNDDDENDEDNNDNTNKNDGNYDKNNEDVFKSDDYDDDDDDELYDIVFEP